MAIAAAESQFHVLAVDDSLIDRTLVARLLKTSSYQVTTVDSGSKALEFLGFHEDDQSKRNPPSILPHNNQEWQSLLFSFSYLFQCSKEVEVNLIITDYCMPGMTGYDLLKKVKESSSLRNIPVVIMSSENVPSRITRCLDEGAEEFFLKPLQLTDLNRLRPYMMKTKLKNQNQVERDGQPEVEKAEIQPQQQRPSQSQPKPPPRAAQQQPQPPLPPPQPASNNNKRKVLEEGLSPDRTRPRYNDITTVV